ncbi:MAG: hypothetical protein AAFX78_18835 [Cyanobacteria bacterium J06638_20]
MTQSQQIQPEGLQQTAQACRDSAKIISSVQIPRLQAELKKLRDNGASPGTISELRKQIDIYVDEASKLHQQATRLDTEAFLDTIVNTEMQMAQDGLKCSVSKVKLALNMIAKFQNFLAITTGLINLSAAIAGAAATGGMLSIIPIVKGIDSLVNAELKDTLPDHELKKIEDQLKKCA